MAKPTKIGVVFGSQSVEHEVSIITATQLMNRVSNQYQVVPLYIDKQGRWWTGESLTKIKTFQNLDLQDPAGEDRQLVTATPYPAQALFEQALSEQALSKQVSPGQSDALQLHSLIDTAIFCVHGGRGEDGTLAGLFELLNIPYVGPGVVAAAVGIDKIITKQVMEAAGLNVTNYGWFTTADWEKGQAEVEHHISHLEYPLFVKPASLGSSVGITRITTPDKLAGAVALAAQFDTRIVVEEAAPPDAIEVNIAVLGTADDCEASISEQPIQLDEFLSYADKYERGIGKSKSGDLDNADESGGEGSQGMAGLSRRIPAPISPDLQSALQDAACFIWKLIDGFGVARIDFFANPSTEEFWVGEVNSPPGSMAYYLWEASGLPYENLIDRLVEIAQTHHSQRASLFASIESNILKQK